MQENIKAKDQIFYGRNTVTETLKTKEVSKLYLGKGGRYTDILEIAREKNVPFVFTEKYLLDKMTENQVHQGVVAVVAPVEYKNLKNVLANNTKKNPLILIYDEVTDANNFGAILRIADAFDVLAVVIGKKRSIQLNAGVAKTSTGAINHVNVVRETNIKHAIAELKKNGFWVACLTMDGQQKVQDFDFNQPLAVVIGGEDKGVSKSLEQHCDFSMNIEMFGTVNSLNVSSATSILCYQKSVASAKA